MVLPVPGGPHSSSDIGWSPSISRRSGEPGASRCCCPTSSSRVRGRIRTASGRRGVRVARERRRPSRAPGRAAACRSGAPMSKSPSTPRHPIRVAPEACRRRLRPGSARSASRAALAALLRRSCRCRCRPRRPAPSESLLCGWRRRSRCRRSPGLSRSSAEPSAPGTGVALAVDAEGAQRDRGGRHGAVLAGEVAGHLVALADLQQRRLDLGADVLGHPAAGAEPAARRRVDRARARRPRAGSARGGRRRRPASRRARRRAAPGCRGGAGVL